MKFKNGTVDEDSDMDSVDSDDLMVVYDSASEGDGEDVFEEEAEDLSIEQERTGIDKHKDDGLTASEDDEEDGEDLENHTAHTTINEDPETGMISTAELFTPAVGASVPGRHTDEMKVDPLPLGSASLPTSPSRRYPTRRSFRESLGDSPSNAPGTSTMRSVSTNMHTIPPQNNSPRSQRYQKRADTKSEKRSMQNQTAHDDRSKGGKSCVTVVVKDSR